MEESKELSHFVALTSTKFDKIVMNAYNLSTLKTRCNKIWRSYRNGVIDRGKKLTNLIEVNFFLVYPNNTDFV